MTRTLRPIVPAMALLALLVATGPAAAWDLLSPGEAALRREVPLTREMVPVRREGPDIRIHAPGGFDLASPVDFDVEILPRGGVAPDMDTLKIEYRLGPIWTDVTDRMRANARFDGLRMRAPGAKLPEGRHQIRLTVGDREGRITIARLSFTVGG